MTIKYIQDKALKYKPNVLKGLQAYNNQYAKNSFSDEVKLIVMSQDEMVAGCKVEVGWNWLYFETLWFDTQDAFNAMMSKLYGMYRDKIEGFNYETYIDHEIRAFIDAGFVSNGHLEDKPKGYQSHFLINTKMQAIKTNDYEILVHRDASDTFDETYLQQYQLYRGKYPKDMDKDEMVIAALDNDIVVGGAYGYINQDYLYTSLLWVDESYRGQKIATQIMNKLEEYAKELNCHHYFLGTCTFQAKDFYLRNGYHNQMTFYNCPENYEDFLMVKIESE